MEGTSAASPRAPAAGGKHQQHISTISTAPGSRGGTTDGGDAASAHLVATATHVARLIFLGKADVAVTVAKKAAEAAKSKASASSTSTTAGGTSAGGRSATVVSAATRNAAHAALTAAAEFELATQQSMGRHTAARSVEIGNIVAPFVAPSFLSARPGLPSVVSNRGGGGGGGDTAAGTSLVGGSSVVGNTTGGTIASDGRSGRGIDDSPEVGVIRAICQYSAARAALVGTVRELFSKVPADFGASEKSGPWPGAGLLASAAGVGAGIPIPTQSHAQSGLGSVLGGGGAGGGASATINSSPFGFAPSSTRAPPFNATSTFGPGGLGLDSNGAPSGGAVLRHTYSSMSTPGNPPPAGSMRSGAMQSTLNTTTLIGDTTLTATSMTMLGVSGPAASTIPQQATPTIIYNGIDCVGNLLLSLAMDKQAFVADEFWLEPDAAVPLTVMETRATLIEATQCATRLLRRASDLNQATLERRWLDCLQHFAAIRAVVASYRARQDVVRRQVAANANNASSPNSSPITAGSGAASPAVAAALDPFEACWLLRFAHALTARAAARFVVAAHDDVGAAAVLALCGETSDHSDPTNGGHLSGGAFTPESSHGLLSSPPQSAHQIGGGGRLASPVVSPTGVTGGPSATAPTSSASTGAAPSGAAAGAAAATAPHSGSSGESGGGLFSAVASLFRGTKPKQPAAQPAPSSSAQSGAAPTPGGPGAVGGGGPAASPAPGVQNAPTDTGGKRSGHDASVTGGGSGLKSPTAAPSGGGRPQATVPAADPLAGRLGDAACYAGMPPLARLLARLGVACDPFSAALAEATRPVNLSFTVPFHPSLFMAGGNAGGSAGAPGIGPGGAGRQYGSPSTLFGGTGGGVGGSTLGGRVGGSLIINQNVPQQQQQQLPQRSLIRPILVIAQVSARRVDAASGSNPYASPTSAGAGSPSGGNPSNATALTTSALPSGASASSWMVSVSRIVCAVRAAVPLPPPPAAASTADPDAMEAHLDAVEALELVEEGTLQELIALGPIWFDPNVSAAAAVAEAVGDGMMVGGVPGIAATLPASQGVLPPGWRATPLHTRGRLLDADRECFAFAIVCPPIAVSGPALAAAAVDLLLAQQQQTAANAAGGTNAVRRQPSKLAPPVTTTAGSSIGAAHGALLGAANPTSPPPFVASSSAAASGAMACAAAAAATAATAGWMEKEGAARAAAAAARWGRIDGALEAMHTRLKKIDLTESLNMKAGGLGF